LAPGLWKHNTRPIQFTLVVDDFGIKYVNKEHAQHLKNTLKEHYKLTSNWTGKQYIGITLDWDYNKCHVHLFMPNYVQKALKKKSTQSRQTTAWRKEATHNTRIEGATIRLQSQAVHPTGMKQVLIPW
jgi:hypothetical protein